MAGESVVLRVGPNANGTGAPDVTLIPLASEAMLRHLAWIEYNRHMVDKLSNGRIAYIDVPNAANEDYSRFNRYFFARENKEGASVHERFNTGGNIADYVVDYFGRLATFNYTTARYGKDVPISVGAIYGPKTMLINEYAASGGDELPWLFRYYKVGPLVGKRTWGGLVGIGGHPSLMDDRAVTAPQVGLWAASGEFAVENKGMPADVEVDFELAAWRAGLDSQLERAVSIVLQDLSKQTATKANRPAIPDWAKPPIP